MTAGQFMKTQSVFNSFQRSGDKVLFCEKRTDAEINETPVLTLAHVGDAVYELLARTRAVSLGACKVETMHKRSVDMVSALSQAKVAERIKPLLSDAELSVFMRGRNAHPHHAAPRGDGQSYALATALEALFGALYLKGENTRLEELWERASEVFRENEGKA
ncbi:MAG: Mini-ribonuclease 3 [Clostridia bacterium]|nr:Mini-ribonuclease 3 [Clostridia bacterium]